MVDLLAVSRWMFLVVLPLQSQSNSFVSKQAMTRRFSLRVPIDLQNPYPSSALLIQALSRLFTFVQLPADATKIGSCSHGLLSRKIYLAHLIVTQACMPHTDCSTVDRAQHICPPVACFTPLDNRLQESLIRLAHHVYLFPFGSVNPSVRWTKHIHAQTLLRPMSDRHRHAHAPVFSQNPLDS
jgi:hypothetical protein